MNLRPNKPRFKRLQKCLLALGLVTALLGVSGCQTLSFYAQAIKGQYQLLAHQQPIQKLLADTNTPAPLKARFELLEKLRAFADTELKLPVDSHYLKYADVHRPFAVWNVEAAPEFSMATRTWWYPFVGRQEYRGYFSEQGAQRYGDRLRKKGFDIYIGGAEAYSTLGWFKDPVLNTFIFEPEPDLAEVIFHELGHQRLFAHGDTDFNEAFATTVGEEGARRWLRARADASLLDQYTAQLRRTRQFAQLIAETRLRLEALYGDQRTDQGKIKPASEGRSAPIEQLRQQKQHILDALKERYALLKADWNGDASYDEWFNRQLNNAKLNSVAAYYDLVPGFERLLEQNGGDLEKFYAAAKQLSKLPFKERHQRLTALGATASAH